MLSQALSVPCGVFQKQEASSTISPIYWASRLGGPAGLRTLLDLAGSASVGWAGGGLAKFQLVTQPIITVLVSKGKLRPSRCQYFLEGNHDDRR